MVFHGGTAIWRCYSGKRFSYDLDFYSTSFPTKIGKFEKQVKGNGLSIVKMKDTGNVVFAVVTDGRVKVKLEVTHVKDIKGTEKGYELVDGTKIEIFCLTIDQLILEKIAAYNDRKFIRDLYDIFYLAQIEPISPVVKSSLQGLLSNTQQPVDEPILKSIIYAGIPPSFDHMLSEIRRRIS